MKSNRIILLNVMVFISKKRKVDIAYKDKC